MQHFFGNNCFCIFRQAKRDISGAKNRSGQIRIIRSAHPYFISGKCHSRLIYMIPDNVEFRIFLIPDI